jgi:hypothetical protein
MYKNIKKDEKIKKEEKSIVKDRRVGCPICGDKDNLRSAGRCVTCLSCGWSRCSL